MSRTNLNMDLNLTSPDQNNLHVKAAMPDDSLHFEVTRTNAGRSTSDVLFHVGLKSPQVLSTRLTWRPQIWQEIEDVLSDEYGDVSNAVVDAKDKVYVEVYEELNSKADVIGRAMSQETENFVSEMSRDMDRLRYDVDTMNNEIHDAYRRNEFYSKSVGDAIGTSYEFVSLCADASLSKVADGVDYVKNGAVEGYRYTTRVGRKMLRSVQRAATSVSGSIVYWTEAACEGLVELLEKAGDFVYKCIAKYAPSLETLYRNCKRKMQRFYRNAVEFSETFVDKLNECPYFQALVEYYNGMLKAVEEFSRSSFYEHLDRAKGAAHGYVVAYVEMGQRFHDEYIRNIYTQLYDKGSKVYTFLGLDNVVNSVAVAAYQRTKSLAVSALQECMTEYATIITGFQYEFEPHDGRIAVEIPLPSPKSSLREVFDPTTYPEYEKLSQLTDALVTGGDCVWDAYYKYKLYFRDILRVPPFDAYAMIAGNQHFVTFDKFHFDFAGECSYLLARDFVDGNFTVAVNYARDGEDVVRKSLTVIVDGKKVDIGSDYKVTVDGAKVELPYAVGDSFVTREGSVVTLENEGGFAVRCNFVHELCTLRMSGYYFGKTGGLFGTYDYEPLLDVMTPQRLLADNIGEFANSWGVGDVACRKENMAVTTNNDFRAKKACKKLFDDDDSIFRPCYKIVEPTKYYEMCMKDLARYDSSMFDEHICTSSAAYTTECNMAGVPVRVPKSCVRCDKYDGGTMNSGDVVKITQLEKVQSADVVFIIEKRECNKDNIKMLKKMAQRIEDSLQKEGYESIRYAVVGFGGEGIFKPPHLQTSDGQEFANIRSISSAFTAIGTIGWSPVDDWTRSPVFEAIRYSAGLPFKAGSTKSFVLLKCSECRAEEVKADYSEMLRTLLDGDVTLHLLMEHEFETKGPSKGKRVRVMGVDRKVAYTQKDIRGPGLSGDRDLFLQLKMPKDFCVPLALEVNGGVFASQMLTETKRSMNKKFIDVMSRRLAKTAKPSDCQVCECISTPDGIGKSVCQRCVSPIVADMISPEVMYSLEEDAGKEDAKKQKKQKEKKKERSRN